MASEGEVTQGKSKAIWDPPTHEKWIDLAVEEVRAGNRNGSHLSKLGWKNFIEKFNLATKRNYDRKQMKNHWDNVKKEWQLWDSLLKGETGLGWDIQRQTVDAPDEWWDAKLQKYPDAAKFRVRGLEHSFKLDELFRDVTATGARAWAPTSGSLPPLYTEDHNDIEIDENLEESDHEGVGDPMKKETKLLGPNRKQFKKGKKNNSTTSKLSKQLDEICEAIKNRSSYIRTDPPGCSVQEVIDKLVTLPGCEPMSPLFKVGTSLFTKKANREIFVALKEPKYQIEWLKEQEFDF
ncbi:L10-interacting MYB domain-containing protein-like [Humulus lupulus]|uniref:L10-interacting MYB domain-containing protein-like n=1 Tax=Humulus lupulus TaxID=3486 RepID=UPI002B405538|nr:L10-interacting MYB domain-containing protein-like [Humulus lupulus]